MLIFTDPFPLGDQCIQATAPVLTAIGIKGSYFINLNWIKFVTYTLTEDLAQYLCTQ